MQRLPFRRLWSAESGERHSWVLDVSPEDIAYDGSRTAYVRDLRDAVAYNSSASGKHKLRVRQRSLARARKLGLRQAAGAYYAGKGWTVGDVQLHHLETAAAGEGEPESWVFAPRCVHMALLHGKECRKAHPHHKQHGKPGGVSLNRRRAALSYL